MPLSALIEEVVAPHRNFGIAIDVTLLAASPIADRRRAIRRSSTASAIFWRMPSISRASGSRSPPTGRRRDRCVTISDDGPGFAPEIIDRIGEPYVRSRAAAAHVRGGETTGLGLGFFIAKTLLERSGATLDFRQPAVPATAARS